VTVQLDVAQAGRAQREAGEHPLELGLGALERIFGVRPTTFVPPGDQFCEDDVETAFRLGFSFVESYYLAFRSGDRFCWAQHVCAPYLDLAGPEWLTAGLPVVGYFHDNDGVDWMRRCLDAWTASGVTRMVDFRELAGALALEVDAEERHGRVQLAVTAAADAPVPVRPVPVRVRTSTGTARVGVHGAGRFPVEVPR
jgi:hypothetical protein